MEWVWLTWAVLLGLFIYSYFRAGLPTSDRILKTYQGPKVVAPPDPTAARPPSQNQKAA